MVKLKLSGVEVFLNRYVARNFITILVSSICITNIASAEDKDLPLYVRLDVGLSQPNGKLDNNDFYYGQKLARSELYGAGIGYVFNKNVRTDLTLTGRSSYKFSYSGKTNPGTDNEFVINANQNISSTTLMLNTYYNVPVNKTLSPYVNVGLGISQINAGSYSAVHSSSSNYDLVYSSGSNKDYNLAWNIGLGAQVKLTNNLACDAFFRFIDLGKTKAQNISLATNNKNVDSYSVAPFLLQSYETGISLIYRF